MAKNAPSCLLVDGAVSYLQSTNTASLILVFMSSYILLIRFLRRRHDRFLRITPYARTASEAHAFTLRFIYGDFHFIAVKSLEFGLFKTYAIPSISSLLFKTGELVVRCPRRYDDTDLLIREFLEHEPTSQRHELAVNRMNYVHGKYPSITNGDYLYVLCVFIVEPIRWVERFGFRTPHDKERHAMHLRWCDIGEKMGIQDVPPTYRAAEQYLDEYEEKFMVYNETNARVAESTTALFLSVVPKFARPFGRRVVHALCPQRLQKAMGFPQPHPLLVWVLDCGLVLVGMFVRYFLPPRYSPMTRTSPCGGLPVDGKLYPRFHPYERTYAGGYRIGELGPVQFCKVKAQQDQLVQQVTA